MKELIIVGAGGFGREVLAWAQDAITAGAAWRIKGFLDDNPAALADFAPSVLVHGCIDGYRRGPNDVFLCAIGRPSLRQIVHAKLKERGAEFATLIHPTAIVATTAILAPGVIICPFSLVSANAQIGEGSALYYHSSVDHDARVGRYCQISAHCDITGGARVEDEVFIGSHATILPKVVVGAGATVGAGAVVTTDVAAGTTVKGVPAKCVRIAESRVPGEIP